VVAWKEAVQMTNEIVPEGSFREIPEVKVAREPLSYGRRLNLRDLPHILRKQKWIPVGCLVVFVAVAAIYSLKATPMYKAMTRIEIEKQTVRLLSFQEVVDIDTTNLDYYNTQYKLLRGTTLAEEAAKRLREAGNPEDAKFTGGKILGMTEIEPVRNSRLVDIVAVSPIPRQAARTADALAEAYIEQDRNKKLKAIKQAAEQLRDELTKAKEKVDASQKALTDYKEKNNIVSLNKEHNLVLQELGDLTAAAAAAETERLGKETRYNHLKELTVEELRNEDEVRSNKVIQDLRTQEFNALKNMEMLAKVYGPKHRKMIAAKEELDNVREEIDKQISRVVQEVEKSYLNAKQNHEGLFQAVENKKKEAQDFASRITQYESLERQVQIDKQFYETILNRGRETDISERTETEKSNIRIVDRAEVPESPFRPRTKLNILLAIIGGLIVGCVGALFVEHMNDTVQKPEDVEVFLGKPFLGAVPIISGRYGGDEDRGKIAHLSPDSTVSEAYKTVLAGIQYSAASNSLKTILVTSAAAKEGKTTTLTNLGISAAQNNRKVLLVDGDLRRPTIHRILGLRKELGLTDYLTGRASLEEIVQEVEVPNLSVVTCGASSPNPSGLVSSDRMKEFAKIVRDKFDLVLFDSPPCTLIADPLILANLVDAVINVTQSGKFSGKMVARGIDLLDGVNANVLGVVLNEVNARDHRYYYYYGYRYHSYYREDEGSDTSKSKKGQKATEKEVIEEKPSASDRTA
jgi:capsular exopolysaccharide synthesis family protein